MSHSPYPLSPDDHDTNFTRLKQYFESFGAERTQGYLDAMQAMAQQIDEMFIVRNKDNLMFESSAYKVRTRLKQFHNENLDLLEKAPAISPELKVSKPG